MVSVAPTITILRTQQKDVYSLDMSGALVDGDSLTSIAGVTCEVSTEPWFADQWTADTVTITNSDLTGYVDATTLTGAGGTYAASTTVTLTVSAPSPGGTQAEIHATTNSSGVVSSTLVIDEPGDGYISAPTLTFPAPLSGGTATATCTIVKDTISVELDASQAPAVAGDTRRIIGRANTAYGLEPVSDPFYFYTDI